VQAFRATAKQNHIRLSIDADQIEVLAAPDEIVQTLINLISNAIKFSPPESEITIRAKVVEQMARFCVEDEGRGIPPENLESIFEQFQQVDASDSRQKGGTGLGLAICQRIIQQHQGQIWVESELGHGSKFYFTLPIALPKVNKE
jgi:signal transduction histidine kinase